jgi:hypothetical protein
MMDRRRFLLTSLAGAFAAPLAGEEQQAGKVYRMGVLERTSPALNAANFVIEYRSAEGRPEPLRPGDDSVTWRHTDRRHVTLTLACVRA